MNFSYETQGAVTYLVCELDVDEQLDSLALGMLTNNHIIGFAPVLYTEMNGARYLKYNISAKITTEQFFSGGINKDRLFTSLQNIVNALCYADEYMIDQSCFVLQPEYMYINVSSCETALVCVPVVAHKDVNAEMAAVFRRIISLVQVDSADAIYVEKLRNFMDDFDAFNIYSFNSFITELRAEQLTSPTFASASNVSPVKGSFDQTISIDDMPDIMKTGAQAPIHPPIQPSAQAPIQPPVQPYMQPPVQQPAQPYMQPSVQQPAQPYMQPSVQQPAQPYVQPPVQQPVQPYVQPPVQQPVQPYIQPPVQQPGFTSGMPAPVEKKQPEISKPAKNAPAFAIPGQNSFAIPSDEVKDEGKKKKEKKPKKEKKAKQPRAEAAAANAGEKKMSFMTLMAHYNKENAAIYKAQKEAAKQNKNYQETTPQSPRNTGFMPPMGQIGMPNSGNFNSAYPPVQPIQPVPVQNSFNETTVLSNFGGETTVLNAAAMIESPSLLRIRNGEKVSINKPVFRIGKEKSYVDYFIGDNTAISRSHANIHTENGEYFIEDTNSTNHTYVNGAIVSGNTKVKLVNGDKVKLANEEFIFSC